MSAGQATAAPMRLTSDAFGLEGACAYGIGNGKGCELSSVTCTICSLAAETNRQCNGGLKGTGRASAWRLLMSLGHEPRPNASVTATVRRFQRRARARP